MNHHFYQQTDMKERIIRHARIQLMDIASSKSWKLITYYRQIHAIWSSDHQNVFQKLADAVCITRKYLELEHEDIFDPTKRAPLMAIADRQKKLFQHVVVCRGKTAVIFHLYYVELWDEMAGYLKNIPQPFDLFVSIPEKKEQIVPIILAVYPEAHIYVCPNRGRDVAPFVEIYSAIVGLGYRVICKIHTKKSPHLSNGEDWRRGMLDELLGSEERVKEILELFERDQEIGMVVPESFLYSAVDITTMTNMPNLQGLSDIMGIPLNDLEFEYPAGSMFWFRAECFKPLSESSIQTKDFPPEHGQLNNTLAHAMERFFGLLIQHAQQNIVESSALQAVSRMNE